MSDYIKWISGQIEQLKGWGLIIPDEEKAFEILSDIGFYRLGFYLFPFEKRYPAKVHREHYLKRGTSLDTITRLYYFDFDLRLILLKYISRIEIHLRTTIVNYMSAKHHNNDTWFVDDKIVSPSYARSFSEVYERIKLSPYIKWHHHNHPCKYAPAWKTLEYMTIGEIMDLFDAISNVTSRLDICKAHGIRSIKTFDNYFTAIRRVRNRCAHGGVLFDYKANGAMTCKGPVDLSNLPDRTNLNGAIRVIKFLTSNISHNRLADLELELQTLIEGCKDDDVLYIAIKVASGLK
jgi:abortive infection bacteriophage resistance protein